MVNLQRGAVFTAALLALAHAGAATAAQVRVTVAPVAGYGLPSAKPVKVNATPAGYADEARRQVSAVTHDGTATLELLPGLWTLSVDAVDSWTPSLPILLMDDPRPKQVSLPLWPVGTLKGSVHVGQGEPLPTRIKVVFKTPERQTSRGPSIDSETIPCPVQGSQWACRVPATVLDVQVRATGFVPTYLWGIRIPPREALDLGTTTLLPGASVSGHVTNADGSRCVRCSVFLAAVGERTPIQAGRKKGQKRAISALTDERGFFQLTQAPPGTLQVVARNAEMAEAAAPVNVEKGAESVLRGALVLAPLAALALRISPPETPLGGRWHVTVLKGDNPRVGVVRDTIVVPDARVSESGEWRFAPVAAGWYKVVVGARSRERWATAEVEVHGDQSEPFDLEIPMLKVRGTVRLGKSPLKARLVFGGSSGSVRIPMASDEEGAFSGIIPADTGSASTWEVFVQAQSPPVRRTINAVRVDPLAGAGEAEVSITLPDTALTGVVVDERGAAVTRAILTVTSQATAVVPEQKVCCDEDGSFRIDGLAPGKAWIVAEKPGSVSEQVGVTISENRDTAPVRLVIRHTKDLVFRIVSPEGDPIPGARLYVLPAETQDFSAPILRTDSEGQARWSVPPGTLQLLVGVGAPDFAYRMSRLDVPPGPVLSVTLDRTAGTLMLDMPKLPPESPRHAFVFHGGSFHDVGYLRMWAASVSGGPLVAEGPPYRIPGMTPGNYSLCLTEGTKAELQSLLANGPRSGTRCAHGTLAPSAEVPLRLGDDVR